MQSKINRRRDMLGVLALAALAPGVIHAQSRSPFPTKPITIIVSAAAGGSVDVSARIVGEKLSQILHVPVVIDNRPGAGGHIGGGIVAKASPDGYTLLCSSGSVLVSGVYRNLTYNPFQDLTPIGMLVSATFLLVTGNQTKFGTLQELIAYGNANPGKLYFASSGTGNSTHIGAEMLSRMTGIKAIHVPYKGSVGALTDLVGGRVDFMIDNKASSLPQISGGKLKALGVTSPKRIAELPNVPAVAELVPGYRLEGWNGLFAPQGTPTDVIEKLTVALKKALNDPQVASKMAASVGDARYLSPEETRTFMLQDQARLAKVVTEANIHAE